MLIICITLLLTSSVGCAITAPPAIGAGLGNGMQIVRSLELEYAEKFRVDYFDDDLALISISDGTRYLVVPQGVSVPDGIDRDIAVLQQPIENIYLVATSAMCLFDALASLGSIKLSGTSAENWFVPNARAAMERGDILYAGKYSAPDYELIMSSNCKLAIESTMINHTPDVRDKLQDVGVAVLTEQSSYEPHPLGRTEWMKLYAVLVGREAEAERLFGEQVEYLNNIPKAENLDKTVAFFYISSSGNAVARKSGDYVAKMIELAGGSYILKDPGERDSASSTITLEMERFYAEAKDADYIIYNSAIDGEIATIGELIAKCELLRDFKAVRDGNVWCTGKNLFQETTQLGLMISDIHRMLTESDLSELNFMYRLS
jgi:iron complex transport system substrate-binding protein